MRRDLRPCRGALPVATNDRIEPRTTLVLSLTVSHHVTDGPPAATFLGDVVHLLGHPPTSSSPLTFVGLRSGDTKPKRPRGVMGW